MDKKKEGILSIGIIAIVLLGIGILWWALFRNIWLSVFILIATPLVALSLKLYYQNEFSKDTRDGIGIVLLLISITGTICGLGNRRGLEKVEAVFVAGRTMSQMQTVDYDEGPSRFERVYDFVPYNEQDRWKITLIDNVFLILTIAAPILTAKLASSIKPKENPNEKTTRFSRRNTRYTTS